MGNTLPKDMIIALLTLFFAVGIIAGYYINPYLSLALSFSAVALLLFLFMYRKSKNQLIQKPYFSISTWLLTFSLGILSYTIHNAPNQKLHYSHYLTDNAIIEGTITYRLKPTEFSERYYFEVSRVNQYKTTGRILLNSKNKTFSPGDNLTITETPKPINKPLNPYQFDYAAYMEKQNIFHQLNLNKNYILTGETKSFNYYLDYTRNKLTDSFNKNTFAPKEIALLKALLLGQRQDLSTETTEMFASAGAIHILAISGLHIAILFLLLNLLLKPLDRLSKRGKTIKLILLLLLLLGFAILSGLSPSVVRAVIMFSFISIGQYLNRNSSMMNSVAISMLLILLFSPKQLFDVGFQLSYTAVIAIIALRPVYKNIRLSKYRVINYFTDIAIISVIAQVSTLPLCLYYFKQIPLLSVITNIIVVPLTGLLLTFGILTLLVNFISTYLAHATGTILKWLIQILNHYTEWIAGFESFNIKDITFPLLFSITLTLVITVFGIWLRKPTFKTTIVVLSCFSLFQISYLGYKTYMNNKSELIVFNNYNESVVSIKDCNRLTILCNDTTAYPIKTIKPYLTAAFNPKPTLTQLNTLLWFKGQKIAVLEPNTIYPEDLKPDIILLSHSPKVNLEKIIIEMKPKVIIADGTNYRNLIQHWKATCHKQNILFHATAEKGYYKLE
ncbi:ComEC/Rec2 family competence protein [Flavobacterium rakeshii]|uniref:ComEC/Rec2 family competence protein n=1 Tax=Flavobacterium rakeshii TaxID=1038845 RepID=UPI002E7B09F8|nr:ComEC/Rec2 family competence protein [Flavobacterium rakeshii]MEE1897774.1 ComEC/Rec2 family competence protein [Flavobacterium rakeshii]